MVPLTLKWFLGEKAPPRPPELEPGRKIPDHGAFYYGTKAVTFTEQYCDGARIIPESKHKKTIYPPKSLPRSPAGHQGDFLNACKGGPPAGSNFDYGGPLTEIALWGNIALQIEKPFTFLRKQGKAVNCPEADCAGPSAPAQRVGFQLRVKIYSQPRRHCYGHSLESSRLHSRNRCGALGLGLVEGMALRALGEPKAAIPLAKAKSVIGVYLEGGMTHIDTFDPKPNAPPSVRSFFKPIPTNVPGTEITELFPLMAKVADKYTIIRSTTAPGGGHGGYVMLCNAMNPKESASPHPSAKLVYPCAGAVAGMKKVENGSYKGDIPPWVCIPGIPWGGNNYGFLPPKYQGFCVGNPNDQYFKAPGVSLSPDELKRFEKRRALLEVVSPAGKGQTSAAQAADALRQGAFRLLTGDAKKAFDLSLEKKEMRDRYGRHMLGQGCLLARRLAEYGVPFINCQLGRRRREGRRRLGHARASERKPSLALPHPGPGRVGPVRGSFPAQAC